MGACRATAGTKQSDIDKARAKKKVSTPKEDAKRAAQLLIWGPVTDKELARSKGWERSWLTVVKGAQKLEASFKFQMFITCIILIAALLIGFVTLPTAEKVPQFLVVMEWTINVIFLLEIALKCAAAALPLQPFVSARFHCRLARVAFTPSQDGCKKVAASQIFHC